MGAGEIGVERYSTLGTGDCVVELETVVMQDRQIVVAMHVLGPQRGSSTAGDQCLVEPPNHSINLADIAMIQCRHRRQRNRALDQLHGFAGVAVLERNDAHQVQRRVMQRRLCQHMRKNILGVVQAPGFFVLCGDLHQLCDSVAAGDRGLRRGGHLRRGPGLRRYRTCGDLGQREAFVRTGLNQRSTPAARSPVRASE
jgi:hypothetical protein